MNSSVHSTEAPGNAPRAPLPSSSVEDLAVQMCCIYWGVNDAWHAIDYVERHQWRKTARALLVMYDLKEKP
jgi:hypothetical protein